RRSHQVRHCELRVWESKKSLDPWEDRVRGLKSFWVGLDVKIKRDFMKVIAKLRSFVKRVHKTKGLDALETCRAIGMEKFSSAEECRTHLEQEHAADFKPHSAKDMVKRIGKTWAYKILVGVWEPVDAVAAVGMIKTQLAYLRLKSGVSYSRKSSYSSNDIVLKSIKLIQKVLLIDAKILLIDNSRIRLLDKLIRLSVFDNRSYTLQLLKPFLLNEIVSMESKVKLDAVEADILVNEEKKPLKEEKSQRKKTKKTKSIKRTSTSMSSPVDKNVERMCCIGMHNSYFFHLRMPGKDSVSGNLESALGEGAARYNSALDMTVKALMNINVLKEDIKYNKQPFHGNLEEQVPYELQNLFSAVVSGEIKTEGVYSFILRDLLASLEEAKSMSSGAAEVLVTILESWHRWTNLERESLVTRLFTLEENERMHCRKCRRMPNYPEQSSYGIVMAADSIRDLKCTFRNMKFVDILKVMRMEYKMLCDIKSGGCGTTNFVHHVISRCPSIFIIVLEWEKSETEKEIFETTKALEWEIDISRLYKGLEQNTNYRLVSMVGYGEEEREHICMAYEKSRWVNLRRESLAGEVVGNNWKNVVRFCGERKVRPEILFYEELPDP
ncbi:uncharacterized protein LOC103855100, partial [Brassica rapa]|uniref:uncharacterized protein LOC103855100 n=1 Tax=Brassica campestris TaxID=3711 RepID=UPI00142D405A